MTYTEKLTAKALKYSIFMDWKILATVFISVFIAEMGDKTQLATMLFASDKEISKWTIFLGASLALWLSLPVLACWLAARCLNMLTRNTCITPPGRGLSLSVFGRCRGLEKMPVCSIPLC